LIARLDQHPKNVSESYVAGLLIKQWWKKPLVSLFLLYQRLGWGCSPELDIRSLWPNISARSTGS